MNFLANIIKSYALPAAMSAVRAYRIVIESKPF